MVSEFLKKLTDLAKLHNVRHDQALGNEEFERDHFEKFLRDVNIISKGKSKSEIA
jgi:hypothetical protein